MRVQIAIICIALAFVLGAVGGFVAGSAYTAQRMTATEDRTNGVFDSINSDLK